jgi:nitrogen regulation protein NR(I)
MPKKPLILLVEDDPNLGPSMAKVLESEDYRVILESTGDKGLERVAREGDQIDLVITDLRLPGCSGLDVVERTHAAHPHLPVILVTAFGTAETAIEATRRGAFDYIIKPFDIPEILDLASRAVQQSTLARREVRLDAPEAADTGDAMVGTSRSMQHLYKEIGRVAPTAVNVLVRGETGTGKELVARAIHQFSPRKKKPFIAVNCAALPESLLESELFGHERGAFTGAEHRRIGRFEQAEGGTLFLDEIGDVPLPLQVKLLRVLQERAIRRLGGKEMIPVDVRLVFATHQPLEELIASKQFREDLYYRINTVELLVPPLRDRREDIPKLVDYFMRRHAPESGVAPTELNPSAMQPLVEAEWPGNVRQLENVVRKILIQSRGFATTAEDVKNLLGGKTAAAAEPGGGLAERVKTLLDEAEQGKRQNILSELVTEAEQALLSAAHLRARGNIAQMARWLGVARLTLREKLKQHGLYERDGADGG